MSGRVVAYLHSVIILEILIFALVKMLAIPAAHIVVQI